MNPIRKQIKKEIHQLRWYQIPDKSDVRIPATSLIEAIEIFKLVERSIECQY